MKENDVAFFGALLGMEPEAVKGAIEDGSLGDKVKALNLMKGDQVNTLKENLTKEVRTAYFDELVEKAKKGEVDRDLYKPIHGAVHEMIEKDLAKEYSVDKGSLKEMIAKISKNGQSNNNEQLLQKITDLQAINENLVKEKDEAVTAAKAEYEGKVLFRDKTDQLNALPLDFSDVDEDKLDQIKTSRKQILSDVFDARYTLAFDNDKLIVKDKTGVRKNPNTLEPLPVSDVMRDLAKELGMKLKSPESGGQGGKSSGTGSDRFKNVDDYYAHCESKGINPTGAEGLKILKDSGLKII